MKKISFTKMQGAGNDFVIAENLSGNLPTGQAGLPQLAQKICDRKTGIGADGLLVLSPSKKTDYKMQIFNSDGSQAEMCGNGVRCLAAYIVREKKPKKKIFGIETLAGIILGEANGEVSRARLSLPKNYKTEIPLLLQGKKIHISYIDTGVPHVVIFVDALEALNVSAIAPNIRHHKQFAPRGANVNFVEQINENFIKVRTFERGVEGETLACGTGSVASAVVTFLKSGLQARKSKTIIKVLTKGGETLEVTIEVQNGKISNVWLKGKTAFIARGEYYV